MFRSILLLVSVLIFVASTSCAAPEPQADFATDQVCEDLVKFTTSLEALQDEAAYSDVNAVKAQFDVVRKNFNSLIASTQNLETAEKEDFENAVAGLLEVVETVPADASVSDTLATLQEPIVQVQDAAENLRTGLECQ